MGLVKMASVARGRLLPLALAGLGLAAACVFLAGCGTSNDERTAHAQSARDAAVAEACRRLESTLGLPAGTVAESSRSPSHPDADVLLEWPDGESEVDLDTGRTLTILQEVPEGAAAGVGVSEAELDAAAVRFAAAQGWDAATLAAEGFTPGEAEMIRRGGEAVEYAKTWVGHDAGGLPNRGLIDVRVDAATGSLLTFFYFPGPVSGHYTPGVISASRRRG